jgi:hypothetical protein
MKHHYHTDGLCRRDFEGVHKDKAEPILWNSKTPMKFSFLGIGQCIDSANDDLQDLIDTVINLEKGMDSFIVTHIQDKNYFTNIDLADERCVKMIEAKLRQEWFEGKANLIKTNKQRVKDFFKKQNWTIKEMTGFEWFENDWGDYFYGPQTDNRLKDTNGVKIYKGTLHIAYYDEYGYATYPMIKCTADKFVIEE